MAVESALSATELRLVLDAALVIARAAVSRTPEELAGLALEQVLALVPADRAAFFLVDPLTDEAVRLAWRERDPLLPARFAPGVGAVGWAIAHRASVVVADARRDPRFQPIRYPVTRSLVALPLEHGGRVTYVLACSSFTADAFAPRHVEMLRLLGEHVSAAFATAQQLAEGGGLSPQTLAEYLHDLRGPLHTALGYLALAAQTAAPAGHDVIAQAQQACRQALELADSVLDAAAEERQAAPLSSPEVPVDLAALLRASVARVQPMAELRKVAIALEAPEAPLAVIGRQRVLERLLDNLLRNAVEHSPEGGTVATRLAPHGDRAVAVVEDEGRGIPEGELEQIFAPFFRAATSAARQRSGGLGLSLARRWAIRSGGRLWAENRAAGGARFVLQLPLAPSRPD